MLEPENKPLSIFTVTRPPRGGTFKDRPFLRRAPYRNLSFKVPYERLVFDIVQLYDGAEKKPPRQTKRVVGVLATAQDVIDGLRQNGEHAEASYREAVTPKVPNVETFFVFDADDGRLETIQE